jgi:hypothetical protein
MTSPTDTLMNELTAFRRHAAEAGDFTRINTFSEAEGIVSTLVHAGDPAAVLARCKEVFSQKSHDKALNGTQRVAFAEAAFMVRVVATDNGIVLPV